jgi:hypothetical protein
MTKSFEEFEVYKKGIQLAKLIFKLLDINLLKKNSVTKIKLKEPLFL